MSTDIVTMQTMAQAVTKSGLFGLKSAEQAVTLMLLAESEGLHPVTAMKQYHIINGKPVLKSAEVLSRFQSAGGKIKYIVSSDTECEIEFTHEAGGTLSIRWDIDKAKAAGIYASNPVWQKYPSNMLRSRCITDGVVALFPACLGGNMPETVAIDTTESIVAEVIEVTDPDKEHNKNKRSLSTQLTKLSFSKADITSFAKQFELGDNKELLQSIVSDKDMLLEYVNKFEEK